ncbi:hypothetical protein XENTR_v10004354 [Xenopus tropicalis]|uniref:MIF4G domain-containing protein n=1 Tax=Xenopus tropicalis TaxID=8364 RepID=A0A7D9NKJ5_XENTR|nr:MIF4G domain-containing protein isoform X1 [Xenopus tropicalis]XP_012827221.2 MIF4G domain-containing protein isoform X1 [Xenopus tropicalis]KAE8576869.1 hypothetical protein XENTR_v10004354 [Xenopus tropicalis]
MADSEQQEDYKIQGFDADTQSLLKTALKEPGSVDLEKAASVIVDQSLRDATFSREAGRMCYTIIQAESKQTGRTVFRSTLLNRLQVEYKNRKETRARSLQEWVCYVGFMCNVFDYLRVNNMPMLALVNPVYDCLFDLVQPDNLKREEEPVLILPTNLLPIVNLSGDISGGLPGVAVASGRGAAGEDELPAYGRAFLAAERQLPPAGRPQFAHPATAARDDRVQGSRLAHDRRGAEVLLQRGVGVRP